MPDTLPSSLSRLQPVQSRAASTLSTLLLSAARVVHAVGAERLTSDLVAVSSGFSIGTVYRYFEDRMHILDALGKNNLEQFTVDCLHKISPRRNPTWIDAFGSVFDYLETEFATQPGFRSIRFGDHLDSRLRLRGESNLDTAAISLVIKLGDNYPTIIETGILDRVEGALHLYDAMLGRAFAFEEGGDTRMIADARQISIGYLTAAQPVNPTTHP